jgi:hypothetical protein
LTSAFWISESLRLDICGLEGIFILATAALDKELELAVVSLSCLGVGTWKDAHNFPFPVWFIYFFIGPFFISFQRKERHKRKLFIGSHSMTIRTKQSSDKNELGRIDNQTS